MAVFFYLHLENRDSDPKVFPGVLPKIVQQFGTLAGKCRNVVGSDVNTVIESFVGYQAPNGTFASLSISNK